MSSKDRERLKVLHEVSKRHITQVQAGKELGVTSRWVRELLRRMKARGDRAVVHGLRGKRSNRRLPEAMRARVVKLFREQKWRRRRARWGELLQWDTSTHDWLEGRGPRLYLIALIDDATSQATARFVEHDSTEENLRAGPLP